MSNKLRKTTRPTPPRLMTEEKVNWYLRQIDNPAFIMELVRDGVWGPVNEKLILSLDFYKMDIPDVLK